MVGGGVVASSDEKTDEKKTFWPFWKLCLIASPQLGVQILWVFLGPNTTSYLISLGATPSLAALNNSAGPIVGFFCCPLVGTWSDQSTSKWGRRRPVIIAGFLATCISGILYSGAKEIMGEGSGAVYLAASMQWVMDFTINAMQTPFRALVADLATKEQQMSMQIFFSVVCSVGGIIAFLFIGVYDKPTEHMLDLTGRVLAINVIAVGIMLAVARETPLEPNKNEKKGLCDPIKGMCNAFCGRPKVFYILIAVQCCVWMGNSVWGMYGKEWFTKSLYEGSQTAHEGTQEYDEYVAGNQAFSRAGMLGSFVALFLGMVFMGLGRTAIPGHLYYAPCIVVGAIVCLVCALVVHHDHEMGKLSFILSQVPLCAAGSIPNGIVALWNMAEERATGKVGSVALQMAILNCCITVGQQLCTIFEAVFTGPGGMTEPVALKNLFLISLVANGLGAVGCAFLGGGPKLEESTSTSAEGSKSVGV